MAYKHNMEGEKAVGNMQVEPISQAHSCSICWYKTSYVGQENNQSYLGKIKFLNTVYMKFYITCVIISNYVEKASTKSTFSMVFTHKYANVSDTAPRS